MGVVMVKWLPTDRAISGSRLDQGTMIVVYSIFINKNISFKDNINSGNAPNGFTVFPL